MPTGDIQDSLLYTFLGMKVLMDRKVLMIEEWPWGPDLRIVGETKMLKESPQKLDTDHDPKKETTNDFTTSR